MKRKIFVVILVLIVIVAVTAVWGYQMFYGSAVEERVTVVLREDESYREKLSKVKSSVVYPYALEVYAKRINLERGIESGAYTFDKGMSVIAVARKLKFGVDKSVRLVINNARTPETLASKIAMQIDADSVAILSALRDRSIIKEMGFDSAEAMFSIFLPNTYEVYTDITPESLVWRMKRESDKFWASEVRQAKLEALGMSAYEVMTLASIVHEETNVADEMPRIAGVYINRLKTGMPLQADPTIKYAMQRFDLRRILKSYLKTPSPYNTYINKGLPPSPICMPSTEAIDAVLNFEKHSYLYFCARATFDGYHNFAATYSEHLRNARAYQAELNKRKIMK